MFLFDVFLSHNSADKPAVEAIAQKLKDASLRPWLDKWNLIAGEVWQNKLADGVRDLRRIHRSARSRRLGA